jgi:5-methylthioadenosine/S-adenosylhomocysteine deaminase
MGDNLIVENGSLWAGPDEYWLQGLLSIKGGLVDYAGPPDGFRPETLPGAERLDAGGGLVMPGLINAHCHAAMVLFRGLADDLPLMAWLTEHMFPAEAKWVNDEMVELCSLLAAGEMLLSGTTCVGDSYFCAGGAVRAFTQAGMRAVVAHGVIDFPAPGAPDPEQGLEVAGKFVEEWQGKNPLVQTGLFAHSLYTCSPDKLKAVAGLAREFGVPWFTHLAETKSEVDQVKEMYGATPGRHLHSLGLLPSLQAAAHGVWLEAEELDLLAAHKVALVHCPESNRKLASGLADVDAWQQAGVIGALGTDGAASNNDLDMIAEMGSAAMGDKIKHLDPAMLPAKQAAEMAWGGSARALDLDDVAGRLLPGYAGDAVVLDINQPHLTPLFDPASALVYSARGSDVCHTIVDGKVLVRDRKVQSFDLAEVMVRVRDLARQVADQA